MVTPSFVQAPALRLTGAEEEPIPGVPVQQVHPSPFLHHPVPLIRLQQRMLPVVQPLRHNPSQSTRFLFLEYRVTTSFAWVQALHLTEAEAALIPGTQEPI